MIFKSLERGGKIYEAKKDKDGKVISFPVVIISQGLGNLADKNYYSAQAIQSGVKVYEGKKAYFDHPTSTEEQEQPGRSVKDIAGHYENVKCEAGKDGLLDLKADFVPLLTQENAIGLIQHSIEYNKKYPDSAFVGISINGGGEGTKMDYDTFIKDVAPSDVEMEKIKQIEGQEINVITKFTDAISADIVTEAGARGRILRESQKTRSKKMKFIESMRKFLLGAEKNDAKMMAEAAKEMDESADDKDKDAKEAAAAEASKGAAIAMHFKNCKKEMEKTEGEKQEDFEGRCMSAAMKKHADESKKEGDKKDADEKAKKEGKKSEADMEKEKKEKAKKEKDDKEAKEAADKDAEAKEAKKKEDDDGDAPTKADMADLKKKHAAEIADMKKEMGKKESEADEKKKESAKMEIELETGKRIKMVEQALAESGLPRYASSKIRELLLEKNRSKDEMDKIITTAQEVHSKAIEQALYEGSSGGFAEIVTGDDTGSNDHLF